VLETAWDDNFATVATLLRPAPYRFAFSRKSVRVLSARTLSITVKPNARGVKLIKFPRYKVRIRLWVTYTPTGGHAASGSTVYGSLPRGHIGSACCAGLTRDRGPQPGPDA